MFQRHLRVLTAALLAASSAVIVTTTLDSTPVSAAPPIHVDRAALPGGDGNSWATAFRDLQDGLAAASSGRVIWVAEGTYFPTDGLDRTISYELVPGVDILGGFENGDTLADRDPEAHPTILSGDLGNFGVATDNSYHVVTQVNSPIGFINDPIVLDGLTIQDGHANGTGTDENAGGGILLDWPVTMTLRNVDVVSNGAERGAGIFRDSGDFDLTIEGSTISANENLVTGFNSTAAIERTLGTAGLLLITDSAIDDNLAGGLRWSGDVTIVRSSISRNTPNSVASGIRVFRGELLMAQSEIATNEGSGGLGFSSSSGGSPVSHTATLIDVVIAKNLATNGSDGPAIDVEGNDGGGVLAEREAHVIGHNVTITDNRRPGNCLDALRVLRAPGSNSNRSGGVPGGDLLSSMTFYNSILWPREINCGGPLPSVVDIGEQSALTWHDSIVGRSGGSGIGWDADLGTDAGGNIDDDPLFIRSNNLPDFDLGLRVGSPAIDIGDAANLPIDTLDLDDDGNTAEFLPVDYAGNDRVQGSEVDAGAYEGVQCPAGATRLYVKKGSTGSGMSWGDAIGELSDALTVVPTCDSLEEIWVAEGTYAPTDAMDESAWFEMPDGIKFFGGFEGVENSLFFRTLGDFPTILSGEIPGPNSDHVVRANAISSGRLDGFTISDGDADGPGRRSSGGGLYIDEGNVELVNLIIEDNSAVDGGGIAFVGPSTPIMSNVIIRNNTATGDGGAVWIDETTVDIVHTTMHGNSAVGSGGGFYADNWDASLIGSAIANNGAGIADQLVFDRSDPTVVNSIVSDNDGVDVISITGGSVPTWRHTLATGSGGSGAGWDTAYGTDLGGNLDVPAMLDANLQPLDGSPAINAGDDTAVALDVADVGNNGNPQLPTPALGFNYRLQGTVDLGAYEGLDADGDGRSDLFDNCPATPNTDQANNDFDTEGDVCDDDDDNDTVLDVDDNCQFEANLDQLNFDGDVDGDACDDDDDADDISDQVDNCLFLANPDQTDTDDDDEGDACDSDDDGDGVADIDDNCSLVANADQSDNDGDGTGDLCDPTPDPGPDPDPDPEPDLVTLMSAEPARLLDTRSGPGIDTIDGLFLGDGRVGGGETVELEVAGRGGVPLDAESVVINVTAINPTATGFLTIYECGAPLPTSANLTYETGDVTPNLTVARVVDGSVCIYTFAETHLVVDVSGVAPAETEYVGLPLARLLDSRPGQSTVDGDDIGVGPFVDGEIYSLDVHGRAGVPGDAAAVVLNLSSAGAASSGFVTAFPCGEPQPTTANLNFVAGARRSNLAIVPVGDDGSVCLFVRGATHLIVDVAGALPSGADFTAVDPARIVDTRPAPAGTTVDGEFVAAGVQPAGEVFEFDVAGRAGVPSDAEAVVLNIAIVGAVESGFATVFPCGEVPLAANLNYVAGQTVPNAVFARVSDEGSVCVFLSGASNLVADVFGAV